MAPGVQDKSDRTSWSNAEVQGELEKAEISIVFVRSFFGWSGEEEAGAKRAASRAIDERLAKYKKDGRLPAPGTTLYSTRVLAETCMVNHAPTLFQDRVAFQEAWFDKKFVDPQAADKRFQPATQKFLALRLSQEKRENKRAEDQDDEGQVGGSSHSPREIGGKRPRAPSEASEGSSLATKFRKHGLDSDAASRPSSVGVEDVPMRNVSTATYAPPDFDHVPLLFGKARFEGTTLEIAVNQISTPSIMHENGSISWSKAASLAGMAKDSGLYHFKGEYVWPIGSGPQLEGAMGNQFTELDLSRRPLGLEFWVAAEGELGQSHLQRIPVEYRRISKQGPPVLKVDLAAISDLDHARQLQQEEDEEARRRASEAAAELLRLEKEAHAQAEAAQANANNRSASAQPTEYPNTGSFREDPTRSKNPALQQPPFPTVVTPAFVEWMSSATMLPTINANDSIPDALGEEETAMDVNDFLQSQIKATHINPENWKRYAIFNRFDPKVIDPQARLKLHGWNPDKQPMAYQFFAGTYVIKSFCEGRIFEIVAAAMGLGKTPIGCYIAYAMMILRRRYTIPSENPLVPSLEPSTIRSDYPSMSEPLSDSNFGDLKELVGKNPTLQQGSTLIITPAGLVKHWAQEIKAFIKDPNVKVVVAHGGSSWSKKEREEYAGCYHPLDRIRPGQYPCPPIAVLIEECGSTWTNERIQRGYITVKELLESDGHPYSFLNEWIVIASKDSVATFIESTKKSYSINTCWALVVIDEFHTTKTSHAKEFLLLNRLKGNPAQVMLSATPYNVPSQVGPAWISAHSRYYEKSPGVKKNNREHLLNFSPLEFAREDGVRLKASLTDPERAAVEPPLWKHVYESAKTMDKFIEKKTITTTSVDDEEAGLVSINDSMLSVEFKQAATTFAKWIKPQMIQFSADLLWCPLGDGVALPAIDIPPHSTFDLRLQVESKFESDVQAYWKELWQPIGAAGVMSKRAQFFGAIERMNVVLLFPCLPALMQQNSALKEELGSFTTNDIKRYHRKDITETELWKIMPHIHALQSMSVVVDFIRQARDGTHLNYFGFPHKLVVVGIKPFNSFIFDGYCTWLESQITAAWRPVDKANEVVSINTWEAGYGQKNRERTALFTQGNLAAEEYSESPYLMNAVASQIKTGLSLPPADIIILLDGTYLPETIIQLSGRVQRNSIVQKAPHTWCFRLSSNLSTLPLGDWQSNKHASQAAIQTNVLAEASQF